MVAPGGPGRADAGAIWRPASAVVSVPPLKTIRPVARPNEQPAAGRPRPSGGARGAAPPHGRSARPRGRAALRARLHGVDAPENPFALVLQAVIGADRLRIGDGRLAGFVQRVLATRRSASRTPGSGRDGGSGASSLASSAAKAAVREVAADEDVVAEVRLAATRPTSGRCGACAAPETDVPERSIPSSPSTPPRRGRLSLHVAQQENVRWRRGSVSIALISSRRRSLPSSASSGLCPGPGPSPRPNVTDRRDRTRWSPTVHGGASLSAGPGTCWRGCA